MGWTEPVRSRLQRTLSGQPSGVPEWIRNLERGDDLGYFGPGSAAWAVHGSIPTLVAGIRALLLQALHPGAMAGVHDWSRYREDPLGRLAGTIRWIHTVSYGSQADAVASSEWVLRLHERVVGSYRDGDREHPYAANDPELLRWVHLAFTDAFLSCQLRWGGPIPGGADGYVAEWAVAGELMGVPHPPRSAAELAAQLRSFAGTLRGGPRVADAVRFIRTPPLARSLRVGYPVLFAGATATLLPEHRNLLGLGRPNPAAVAAVGPLLAATRRVLGPQSAAETAALRRRDRLRAAGTVSAQDVLGGESAVRERAEDGDVAELK